MYRAIQKSYPRNVYSGNYPKKKPITVHCGQGDIFGHPNEIFHIDYIPLTLKIITAKRVNRVKFKKNYILPQR